MKQRLWPGALAIATLIAASCGGSPSSGDATTPDAPTSDASVPATEPVDETDPPTSVAEPTTTVDAGPVAASSLEEVRSAVVRIVGTGSFADPADGIQANVPGSGTGFVIDPTGLAVTNNHVVTGAAKLEVFVHGEDDPRNARVLGVSECSDLAVIQIDSGPGTGDSAGFDYLEWYEGPVVAGMDVFAAGFPLGDSEYTLLDGIVSKEDAAGDTSWASVDSVIEHSADTLPGNSGGPIVAEDGRVVAVNYAGNDLGQSFAIGRDVALPVVDELMVDVDVDSIGINGEAVADGSVTGIWVYSVQSGSPADVAGVRAGDLILTMESISLATDETLADYCDVLRSHLPTDTMSIEVYRPADDQVLAGQLNGRELGPVTSFAAEVDDVIAEPADQPDAGTPPPAPPYANYVEISDDSGLITVSIPAAWEDVDRRTWESELATGTPELIGPGLSASPDLDGFTNTWAVPGVFIGASPLITTSIEETLEQYWFGDDCTYDSRNVYDDGTYSGLYDVYTNCGQAGSTMLQVIAEPPDQTWIASVQIVVVTQADLIAADEIFRTFVVQDLAG